MPYEFELESLARVAGPAPIFSADWGVSGWLKDGAQLLSILRRSNSVSGVRTVTFSGDPAPFPMVGPPVNRFPGHDLRRETRAEKSSNCLNLGGHPYIPRPPGNKKSRSSPRKSGFSLMIRNGGAEEIRTPDPHNAIVVLYQLSYDPNSESGADDRNPGLRVKGFPDFLQKILGPGEVPAAIAHPPPEIRSDPILPL